MSITDRARDALKDSTPGPWVPSRNGYIGSVSGVMIHDGQVLGDTDADTRLIAASPELAAAVVRAAELADDLEREATLLRSSGSAYVHADELVKREAAVRIRDALEGVES